MENCPNCNSDRISKNGKTASGMQRYRCKDCGKTITGNNVGRPLISDRKLTPAQKQARYRKSLKNKKQNK